MKISAYTERTLDEFLKIPRRMQLIMIQLFNDGIVEKSTLANFKNVDISCMENCESPIEQMMALAFELITAQRNPEYLFLEPQLPVTLDNGKTYRPDFTVGNFNTAEELPILVECDGHDFHEKSKAQVKRDNERDYDLKMAGYEVLHFSGSQIYDDPIKCAFDVFKYATKYSEKHGINDYERR